MTPTKLSALLAAALMTFALAACGEERTNEDISDEPVAGETTEAAAPAADVDVGEISTDTSKKPEIAKPKGDPPPALVQKDIVVGKGEAAQAGDTLSMQYVGVSFSTGKQFDASWDRGGEPFTFPLGQGQVIQGWDQGIVGMKPGGRRLLVIPPAQGYGEAGSPPDILPNETLVFVVDLEKVEPGSGALGG
nr:FKBP-type peptidyl-prolyl cis-trans isomerase [Paraconexibacter algicola]